MPPTYSEEEQIAMAIQSMISDVWTALPGVVVSFDAQTCTADVKPMVRRVVPVDDDEDTTEDLAILPDLPVVFPQSAAGVLRFPLAPGDPVLVVCATYSPTKWRLTGETSDPEDTRQHHLAHSVVIPGWVPDCNVQPLAVADGVELRSPTGPVVVGAANVVRVEAPAVRLGIDGASDVNDKLIAIAEKVDSAIAAIVAAVNGPHTVTGGTVTLTLASQPSVAATRTKAR